MPKVRESRADSSSQESEEKRLRLEMSCLWRDIQDD